MVSKEDKTDLNVRLVLFVACITAIFGFISGVFNAATTRVINDAPVFGAEILVIAAALTLLWMINYIVKELSVTDKKPKKELNDQHST